MKFGEVNKMKLITLTGIIFLSFVNIANAGPQKALSRGYVLNDSGEKCWFDQQFEDQVLYFFERHAQDLGVMVFDTPGCMADSGLGLDANKLAVNNLISKWYSHDDAQFKTHPSDIYPSSQLQIKGQCMQSETYPSQGILVDYKIHEGSIVRVTHGGSMGQCKD
jgi:hypothetical protein